MQDVCISLDLSDATTLPASVRKLLRVVAAVPRMERCIGDICEVVFKQGGAYLPQALSGCSDPNRVPEVSTGERQHFCFTALVGKKERQER